MAERFRSREQISRQLIPILKILAGLLVLKVTVSVVLNYREYFPPNFESSFLQGRRSYFFGWYAWAFYLHILSGPVSLSLGVILISEAFRQTFPQLHRYLGRIQALVILFLVAPSGLAMAWHAETGAVAAAGFATLSLLTGLFVALGSKAAVQRRFGSHRLWMWRCFLLLCSAVVLRLIAGLSDVTNVGGEWLYPLTGWVSWLIPLGVFELARGWQCRRCGVITFTAK